jgi:beta-ureidopropionase / N-carbamoyl-L-amino-acid hydrolase
VSIGIDAARLWEDLMALGAITEPDRPYTRRSFSPLFDRGRVWLTEHMQDAHLRTHIDAAGNLIGRRGGRDNSLPAIVVGSHSDSVPSGGRFDGMAGVASGIAIARALNAAGVELDHPLEVIDFLAEEPNEFGLSCVGSRGITGCLTQEHLAFTNPKKETLADALARVGGNPHGLGAARRDIKAAFELHIEQGPVLEAEGIDIGVVTAIVGITRIEIEFKGRAGHAGTTPMRGRRDPLIAAAHMVGWIRDRAVVLAGCGRGHFVATVGIIEALPGASNVIPRSARIVIDARSEDRALMEDFRRALDEESRITAGAASVERAKFSILSDTPPAGCDPRLQRLLADSAASLGLTSKSMASGAGHDMAFIAQIAPAAMVFIPCKEGLSHNPDEWTSAEALEDGTRVVLEAILKVDSVSREMPKAFESRGAES